MEPANGLVEGQELALKQDSEQQCEAFLAEVLVVSEHFSDVTFAHDIH